MLHHPALSDIPRIVVPEAWTVCGSPAYTKAARSIAAQIARHDGAAAMNRPVPRPLLIGSLGIAGRRRCNRFAVVRRRRPLTRPARRRRDGRWRPHRVDHPVRPAPAARAARACRRRDARPRGGGAAGLFAQSARRTVGARHVERRGARRRWRRLYFGLAADPSDRCCRCSPPAAPCSRSACCSCLPATPKAR